MLQPHAVDQRRILTRRSGVRFPARLQVLQGIASALADHLAFPLANRGQHVHHEPSRSSRGVQGFLQADEGQLMSIELLDKLVQVAHRAGQPIQLADDDNLNLARCHQLPHPLYAGALEALCAHAIIADDFHELPIPYPGIGLDLDLLRRQAHSLASLIRAIP